MADFFEVDFLDVETDCSGDAITVRYEINGVQTIHVVDGGFQVTGQAVVDHLKKHYGATRVDHVVATHCDRDHAGGLRTVLAEMEVGTLWMLRPWEHAEELLPRFPTYSSADRLRSRLRTIYENLVELENIAIERNISIREPFQGADIGAFKVLAPSRALYLDLIVESDKTPESIDEATASLEERMLLTARKVLKRVLTLIKAAWGEEAFSSEPTSAENEMSVVQFARLSNQVIVLTGDSGRRGLDEAARYAPTAGLALPGVSRIQIPHHGSRRNVSSELLDRWLGPKLPQMPEAGKETFTAIVSSAKADEKHPRKAVVRAFMHRGAKVLQTESQSIRMSGGAAPAREGWVAVSGVPYPDEQES